MTARPIYRTGRKVGRTIYVQRGDKPSDRDRFVGALDTPDLAGFAVEAMNLAGQAEATGLELAEPSAPSPASRSAEDERDSLARRLAVRFAELEQTRAERDLARREAADLESQLADMRAALSAAEAEVDRLRTAKLT